MVVEELVEEGTAIPEAPLDVLEVHPVSGRVRDRAFFCPGAQRSTRSWRLTSYAIAV